MEDQLTIGLSSRVLPVQINTVKVVSLHKGENLIGKFGSAGGGGDERTKVGGRSPTSNRHTGLDSIGVSGLHKLRNLFRGLSVGGGSRNTKSIGGSGYDCATIHPSKSRIECQYSVKDDITPRNEKWKQGN